MRTLSTLLRGGAILLTAAAFPAQADDCGQTDLLAVKQLVLEDRYGEAETRIACVERRFFAGETTDTPVHRIYQAFANTEPGLERHIDEWIKEAPRSHRPYIARARHYQALAWVKRGAAWASDTRDEQFEKMQQYMRKARADLRTALHRKPDLTVAYADLIRMAKATEGPQAVLERARKGLEHYEASYPIRYALLYALQPRWGGSIQAIREVIDQTEPLVADNPELRGLLGFEAFVRGNRLMDSDEPGRALEQYDQAVAAGEVAVYYRERANALTELERYDAAEADFRKRLEITHRPAKGHNDLAEFLDDHRNDLEGALSHYDKALAYDPLDPDAREERGYIHWGLDQWQKALEDLRKATVHGSFDAGLHHNLAELLIRKLERPKEAIEYAERAHQLDPEEPEYLYTLITAKGRTQNCSVMADMEAYLEICRSTGDCEGKRERFIDKRLNGMRSRGTCD